MIWPFPGNTRITTGFHAPRPISNPGEHPHGAIDIGLKIGSKIIAPERGELYKYFAIRYKDGQYWNSNEGPNIPFKNYFYDMYGGLFILKGDSGLTHIFAHIYMNQLYNYEDCEWEYTEQKADDRFPLHCLISGPYEIIEGYEIGKSGNSGYSTSPHCHYEIHKGWNWQKHINRPNPQEIIWENFE